MCAIGVEDDNITECKGYKHRNEEKNKKDFIEYFALNTGFSKNNQQGCSQEDLRVQTFIVKTLQNMFCSFRLVVVKFRFVFCVFFYIYNQSN